MRQRYDNVPLFPVRCFNFQASDVLVEDTLEKVKKLDSRGLGVTRQSGLGKKLKNESVNEGAPDTELDHHKGKNPDIFDQDYLPMKKNGKKMKAINTQSSGGY